MGDEQRLSPDEQLAFAREQFDGGRDLTLAVEEEFALLDPETLDLVNRFEELQAAARGTPLPGAPAGGAARGGPRGRGGLRRGRGPHRPLRDLRGGGGAARRAPRPARGG